MRLTPLVAALHATALAAWLAALVGFIALARWADGTYYLPGDKRASIWIQDSRDGVVEPVFHFVNIVGGFQWIAVAMVVLFALLVARGRLLEAAIVLGAGAMRYVQLGARAAVDRPFSWDEPPVPVKVFPNADSFPSGHVMGEVLAYVLIFAFVTRIIRWAPVAWLVRGFALFVLLAGGPARLYTGAHWLSDVVGAVLLALVYLIPALWLDAVMRMRERPEAELAVAPRFDIVGRLAARVARRPRHAEPAGEAPGP